MSENGFLKKSAEKVRGIWHADIKASTKTSMKSLYSIHSFCQNEFLLRQGVPVEQSARYQFYKKVHELLTVYDVRGGTPCSCGE